MFDEVLLLNPLTNSDLELRHSYDNGFLCTFRYSSDDDLRLQYIERIIDIFSALYCLQLYDEGWPPPSLIGIICWSSPSVGPLIVS